MARTDDPYLWHETWSLRNIVSARCGRHGRSVSRERHTARPDRSHQSSAFASCLRRRIETTHGAGGESHFDAATRAYLHASRHWLAGWDRLLGYGISRGPDARRATGERA